jgi:F0F1-type ATP synthase assembly protein I
VTTNDPRGPSWLRSLQSFQSGIQQAGPAATAGYTLIGAIGLCGALGYGMDSWLGSAPTGLVSGLLIGVGAGMYLLARQVWRR